MGDDGEWVGVGGGRGVVEETAFVVPQAEQMQRCAAFAVLQVEVHIDPFHEHLQQVGGREAHQEVLDPPFLIVLVLFLHPRSRHDEPGVRAQLHQVVDQFDQVLFVPAVPLKRPQYRTVHRLC